MNIRPNILLFIMDAAQASAFEPGSACITPNFDLLRDRGMRFTRAYSPSPTCSPSRASLMTGLLPHNHGVLEVEHGRDPDQCNLRTDKPHFAQRLSENDYTTGYFGKWHVERSNELLNFGWQTSVVKGAEHHKDLGKGNESTNPKTDPELSGYLDGPDGYRSILHWGVTDVTPEKRYPQQTGDQVISFVETSNKPFCVCASFSEPNETLIVSRTTFERYESREISLPETLRDTHSNKPGLYRREASIAKDLSDEHWRMARTCYYGRITELDDQFGRIISKLEDSGQLNDTIIIVTADHGRYVGNHGFDAHNIGAYDEIYNVPLLIAGPGIQQGECTSTVNFHDLCPTICELTQSKVIDVPDSVSLLPQLKDPAIQSGSAYAENHGSRFRLTQRILWDGSWKFVFNGFDFDELYNLEEDPEELSNLIDHPDYQDRADAMMKKVWQRIKETGDRTIEESHYFSLRLGRVGPLH